MDFIHKIISERRAARLVGKAVAPVTEPVTEPAANASVEQAIEPTPNAPVELVIELDGLPEDSAVEYFADACAEAEAETAAAPAASSPEIFAKAADYAAPHLSFDEPTPQEASLAQPDPAPSLPRTQAEPPNVAPSFAEWDRPQHLRAAVSLSGTIGSPVAAQTQSMEPSGDSHVHVPSNQLNLNEMPFVLARAAQRSEEILTDVGVQMPPPAAGRGSNRSGHVKTRLLGFNPEALGMTSPFDKSEAKAKADSTFPVGWLVVVAGPGHGAAFALHDGVARIGRGEDQEICLNFGDGSISRENHLSVAFDSEQNAFFIGQSGRSNIVRLNNKPLLSTEQVRSGDQIRVGETTLRLAALCGDDFSWTRKV